MDIETDEQLAPTKFEGPLSLPPSLPCNMEYEHILRSGTLLGNMSPGLTLPAPSHPIPRELLKFTRQLFSLQRRYSVLFAVTEIK